MRFSGKVSDCKDGCGFVFNSGECININYFIDLVKKMFKP